MTEPTPVPEDDAVHVIPVFTRNGSFVEVARSGDGNPPGTDPARRHTNRSTVWARLPGGRWVLSPHRSTHRTVVVVRESPSAAEAVARLVGDGP